MKKEILWGNSLGYNNSQISYLGSGDFGEAFETDDNKVIKITRDKDEFLCAHYLKEKNCDNLSKIYNLIIFDEHCFGILMEKLETDGCEDVFSEIKSLEDDHSCHFTELDLDEISNISDNAIKMIDDLYKASLESSSAGFHANDIHAANIGINSNGDYALFDQRSHNNESIIEESFNSIKDKYTNELLNFLGKKISEDISIDDLDMDDIKDRFLHLYFDEDDLIEKIEDKILELNSIEGNIDLYRVLFLKDINNFNSEELGNHWVEDLYILEDENFINYLKHECSGETIEGDAFLVTANFKKTDIDLESTIEQFLLNPNENEIYIKKGKIQNNYKIESHIYKKDELLEKRKKYKF